LFVPVAVKIPREGHFGRYHNEQVHVRGFAGILPGGGAEQNQAQEEAAKTFSEKSDYGLPLGGLQGDPGSSDALFQKFFAKTIEGLASLTGEFREAPVEFRRNAKHESAGGGFHRKYDIIVS